MEHKDGEVSSDCPKCSFPLAGGTEECPVCGIVISRYLERHRPAAGSPPPPPQPDREGNEKDGRVVNTAGVSGDMHSSFGAGFSRLFFPLPSRCTTLATIGCGLFTIILLWISLNLALAPVEQNRAGASFLHLINLPFHEAGHIFFIPFGDFMHSLGGTLGQFMIPLICMGAFIFYRFDNFAAAVCLWWTGENFLDIAPYVNDARAGVLPLIGGNTGQSSPYGFHDWEYLLTETGLLGYDQQIAMACAFVGTLVMASALLWAGMLVWRQFQCLRAGGPAA